MKLFNCVQKNNYGLVLKSYQQNVFTKDISIIQGLDKIIEKPGNFKKIRFLISVLPWNLALCSSFLTVFGKTRFLRWSSNFILIFGYVFWWSFLTIHVRIQWSLLDSFRFLHWRCFSFFLKWCTSFETVFLARPNNSEIFVTLAPALRAPKIWTLLNLGNF